MKKLTTLCLSLLSLGLIEGQSLTETGYYNSLDEQSEPTEDQFVKALGNPNTDATLKMYGDEVPLEWPINVSDEFPWESYYAVRLMVDHDTSSSEIDAYCDIPFNLSGNGFFSTHVQIFPFPYYLIENDLVEIVSVKSGVITEKVSGYPDELCDWTSNNSSSNQIRVFHDDGTEMLYRNLKSGSLTSKAVGQSVATGEFLGIPGASGSSDGVNLRFYYWNQDGDNTDPYYGDCNESIGASLWATEQNPKETELTALTTHSGIPSAFACTSDTELTLFANEFSGGDSLVIRGSYRHIESDLQVFGTLTKPDGSLYSTEVFEWSNNAWGAWSWWSFILPETDVEGLWTVNMELSTGTSLSQEFWVNESVGIDELEADLFKIHPNPAKDKISIQVEREIPYSIVIRDASSRIVLTEGSGDRMIDVSSLSKGLYTMELHSQGLLSVEQFIKE